MVTMKKLLLRSFLLNIMCFLDEKFSKYKNSEGVRQKKNKINIKKKEQSGTIDSANEANNGKKQLFEKVDTTREGHGINNGEIN